MLGSIKHSLHTIQFTVNTTKDAGKKEKKLKQKRNEISPQIIYIINIIHHTLLDPTQITIKTKKQMTFTMTRSLSKQTSVASSLAINTYSNTYHMI